MTSKRKIDRIGNNIDALKNAEKKQTRTAFQKSEEKYRSILDNMAEVYLETDLKGNFIFFNDAWCRVLGYSRAELQNSNYHLISTPETEKELFNDFQEIYQSGKIKTFVVHTVVAKDGSLRIVEMSVSLMRSPTKEPVGFSCIGRDVTEKLKAERSIMEREKQWHLIAYHTRDIIWTMDFNLNYKYLSPSVLPITGYTPEEFIKKPLTDIIPPKKFARLEQVLAGELAKESNRPLKDKREYVTFETQIIKKNGEMLWVEISADFNRDETASLLKSSV